MASAISLVWLSTSRIDTVMGPSRPVLYTPPPPPSRTTGLDDVDAPAPPPNIDEAAPAWQAQASNALIPFSTAPHLSAARFVAAADREAPAQAMQCLTSAVYYEAGTEPEAGKRAVAQVVVNRWASRAFPKTICGVIHQGAPAPGCQFSFMCDGALGRKPSAEGWADAEMVARAALNGYVETCGLRRPGLGGEHAQAGEAWPSHLLSLARRGRFGDAGRCRPDRSGGAFGRGVRRLRRSGKTPRHALARRFPADVDRTEGRVRAGRIAAAAGTRRTARRRTAGSSAGARDSPSGCARRGAARAKARAHAGRAAPAHSAAELARGTAISRRNAAQAAAVA
jgi:hypothetical protein